MRESVKNQELINKSNMKKEIDKMKMWGNASADELAKFVDDNVTADASVKDVLKKMVRMLAYLRDK